ncbi:MAG: hypothetical protein LBF68_07275, partial [Christensenellaceae bacterium]|jgi:hypothetical protein|nr:hypothetical protein [Christensenellaceae bacterium]
MDLKHINITNQKELDEFLNGTTVNKSDYCIDVRADEPLVVKSSEVNEFKIFGDSVVRFLEVPFETCINAYENAVAIIESENCYLVQGYDNSIIFNSSKYEYFVCKLYDNAKFENSSLNSKTPSEMYLTVNDITTQERLDECVKLYGNYKNARFCITQSYSEHGSELVVNQKINGFLLLDESRVVFKKPTNSDNESIDYDIAICNKSTAIIETNNCEVSAYNESTIIKRCKGDIAYKYIKENSKLVDESHLLDTNKHKETSKGRGK